MARYDLGDPRTANLRPGDAFSHTVSRDPVDGVLKTPETYNIVTVVDPNDKTRIAFRFCDGDGVAYGDVMTMSAACAMAGWRGIGANRVMPQTTSFWGIKSRCETVANGGTVPPWHTNLAPVARAPRKKKTSAA